MRPETSVCPFVEPGWQPVLGCPGMWSKPASAPDLRNPSIRQAVGDLRRAIDEVDAQCERFGRRGKA